MKKIQACWLALGVVVVLGVISFAATPLFDIIVNGTAFFDKGSRVTLAGSTDITGTLAIKGTNVTASAAQLNAAVATTVDLSITNPVTTDGTFTRGTFISTTNTTPKITSPVVTDGTFTRGTFTSTTNIAPVFPATLAGTGAVGTVVLTLTNAPSGTAITTQWIKVKIGTVDYYVPAWPQS